MIKKAGYNNMDWVTALAARSKPKDPTADLGAQNEADIIDNALESTASAAFDLPVKAESRDEALHRASRDIGDRHAAEQKMAPANAVRAKLASAGINPVELGILIREANGRQRPIAQEEWEGASDVRFVEKVAMSAALEYEKKLSHAWEDHALQPHQHLTSRFDPMTMGAGKIMSATNPSEDVTNMKSRLPANAASILDPNRLDAYAASANEHDDSVVAIRQQHKDRIAEKKEALRPDEEAMSVDPMKSGQVMRSGSMETEAFIHRVPSNQISMIETMGEAKLTPEELKERLSRHFSKIVDNGVSIKEASKKHRESIQETREKDKSWEKVEKSTSTSDLAKRLMDRWMPPEPGK